MTVGRKGAAAKVRDVLRRSRALAPAAVAPVAALFLGGATDGSKTYTYVLSNVYVASHPDEKACPAMSKTAVEIFLDQLPPALRADLADPAKEDELEAAMRKKYPMPGGKTGALPGRNGASPIYSPQQIEALRAKYKIPPGKGKLSYLGLVFGYNMCTDPDDFPSFAVGAAPSKGEIAYGIDLNGTAGRGSFRNLEGETGVDNALIRATGCNRTTRDYGDPKVADNVISSIMSPPILQVSGIDDPTNDENVTVRFYSADSPLELTGQGKPLAWATYDVDPEPRFQVSAKGTIRNGVLETEPFDLRIRMREVIVDGYREVKGARLRVALKDGEAIGGQIFGYHTIASLFDQYAQAGTVGLNLMSCPAAVKSIRQYADGYPDPRTGRNTAISTALQFRGVPAFAHRASANAKDLAQK